MNFYSRVIEGEKISERERGLVRERERISKRDGDSKSLDRDDPISPLTGCDNLLIIETSVLVSGRKEF